MRRHRGREGEKEREKKRVREKEKTIILLARYRAVGGRRGKSHKRRQIDLRGKGKSRREPEIFSSTGAQWSGSLEEAQSFIH